METPGLQYRMAWPNYELESARGTRKRYTIDFAGKQYPAKAMLQPPFDPKNEKIMV